MEEVAAVVARAIFLRILFLKERGGKTLIWRPNFGLQQSRNHCPKRLTMIRGILLILKY